MEIPVGPFLPDISQRNTPTCTVATNVFPAGPAEKPSYIPVPNARNAFTGTMEVGAAPCGVAMAQLADGSYRIFAGTNGKLFMLSGTSWTPKGSGYQATSDERWSFAQFGSSFIAVNLNDDPQVYDLTGSGSFGALGGSPPKARFVDTYSDFVILAGLASDPASLQWSGINNSASWTPGTLLSDIQTFPNGGRVMNISAAAGLVIQETIIRQMVRSPGSGLAFEFAELERGRGCIAPFSVIKKGASVGFLSEDGFYWNGAAIGKGRVDRYFLGKADLSRLYSVKGCFDPTGSRIIWAAKTSSADYYDFALCYDWSLDRWSELDGSAWDVNGLYDIEGLATPGLTMSDLDGLYATMDDVPYSLDSRVWLGGRPALGALLLDGQLAFFEGPAAAATVEIAERDVGGGSSLRTLTQWVRPMIDTSAATVAVSKRERLADTKVWGTATGMTTSGRTPQRAGGRLQGYRINVPGSAEWTHLEGVAVDGVGLGIR